MNPRLIEEAVRDALHKTDQADAALAQVFDYCPDEFVAGQIRLCISVLHEMDATLRRYGGRLAEEIAAADERRVEGD